VSARPSHATRTPDIGLLAAHFRPGDGTMSLFPPRHVTFVPLSLCPFVPSPSETALYLEKPSGQNTPYLAVIVRPVWNYPLTWRLQPVLRRVTDDRLIMKGVLK
jgi:hypothetical protein